MNHRDGPRTVDIFLERIADIAFSVWTVVIQNVCKKLSLASNDSEEKLETMTEALNEAYQQQNDRIIKPAPNFVSICTLTHKGKITEISTRTDCA